MEEVNITSPDVNIALNEYYEKIRKIFDSYELQMKMFDMLAGALSREEVREVYLKYNSLNYAYRFPGYNLEQKIESINRVVELLDYFGFEYPSPLEIIKQHLKPKGRKEDESGNG